MPADPTHDPAPRSAAPADGLPCDAAAGLLPWLVNGSLEGAERRRLGDHLAACEACRGELADTAAAAAIFAQHVPSLALAEYALGVEPGELDRERIEAHLAACPSCREELALAREGSDNVVELAPRRATAPGRRGWRRLAIAASLGAVSLSGLYWVSTSVGPAVEPAAGDRISRAETSPAPDVARHEQAKAGQLSFSGQLFLDGFESGDTSTWSAAASSIPEQASNENPERQAASPRRSETKEIL